MGSGEFRFCTGQTAGQDKSVLREGNTGLMYVEQAGLETQILIFFCSASGQVTGCLIGQTCVALFP